jgi:hypothetical protein
MGGWQRRSGVHADQGHNQSTPGKPKPTRFDSIRERCRHGSWCKDPDSLMLTGNIFWSRSGELTVIPTSLDFILYRIAFFCCNEPESVISCMMGQFLIP